MGALGMGQLRREGRGTMQLREDLRCVCCVVAASVGRSRKVSFRQTLVSRMWNEVRGIQETLNEHTRVIRNDEKKRKKKIDAEKCVIT